MSRGLWGGITHSIGLRRNRELYGTFRNLVRERRSNEAIEVGHVLLARMPANKTIRRSLAACYARTGNDDRAAALLLDGIAPALLRELERPIAQADSAIDPKGGGAKWRSLPKGISNVCVVDHGLTDRDGLQYVTKVTRGTRRHKEVRFFERIQEWSPEVARLAPRMLLCQDLPRFGMTLLTIEKVIGRQPQVQDSAEVIRAHEVLSRTALPEAHPPRLLPQRARDALRREMSWLARRRILLPETFTRIHSRQVNERLLARLGARERYRRWPRATAEVFGRLRRTVLDGEQYLRVEPERDYTFVHGDFRTANLLIDSRDGRVRVLDWESYRTGPPCLDLVRYFGHNRDFIEFDPVYGPVARGRTDAASTVRYALLTYGLLVTWFERTPARDMEDKADTHFLPAIERLEELMHA